MKNNGLETVGFATLMFGIVGALVFMPAITFMFAYFGGWILKITFGAKIVAGLNLVFNTTRFTTALIPLACATFATIGKYFKSVNTNNNKKD